MHHSFYHLNLRSNPLYNEEDSLYPNTSYEHKRSSSVFCLPSTEQSLDDLSHPSYSSSSITSISHQIGNHFQPPLENVINQHSNFHAGLHVRLGGNGKQELKPKASSNDSCSSGYVSSRQLHLGQKGKIEILLL